MSRGRRSTIAAICATAVGLAAPQVSQGANIVVNTAADSGGGSLRTAITDANATVADDVITFSLPGTPGEIELFTQLPAVAPAGTGGKLTIQGTGSILLDIQRAETAMTSFPVITAAAGADLTINDLTISNGASPTSGGGILTAGTVVAKAVVISGNEAVSSGGGAATISSGSLTLRQSTVTGNSAGSSGGGGVTASSLGNVTIERSTISGNSTTALSGAGLRVDGPATVRSSTIANNTGPVGTPMTGKNISLPTAGAALSLQNTIVADAKSTDPMEPAVNCQVTAGTITSLGFNMADDASCNLTETSDHPEVDPALKPLALNPSPNLANPPPKPTPTHALPSTSPAVDQGNVGSATGIYDQRGFMRPAEVVGLVNAPGGDGSDIGAFELQASYGSSSCGGTFASYYVKPTFRCSIPGYGYGDEKQCVKRKKKGKNVVINAPGGSKKNCGKKAKKKRKRKKK